MHEKWETKDMAEQRKLMKNDWIKIKRERKKERNKYIYIYNQFARCQRERLFNLTELRSFIPYGVCHSLLPNRQEKHQVAIGVLFGDEVCKDFNVDV